MTLIVCLDDHNGMAFNGRRQSMDSALRARLLEQVGNGKLWMSKYSAKQFQPMPDNVIADDCFLDKAQGDACFVETQDPTSYLPRCSKLLIYRWNRVYPADLHFPLHAVTDRLKKVCQTDFVGSSHARITEEVYEDDLSE